MWQFFGEFIHAILINCKKKQQLFEVIENT